MPIFFSLIWMPPEYQILPHRGAASAARTEAVCRLTILRPKLTRPRKPYVAPSHDHHGARHSKPPGSLGQGDRNSANIRNTLQPQKDSIEPKVEQKSCQFICVRSSDTSLIDGVRNFFFRSSAWICWICWRRLPTGQSVSFSTRPLPVCKVLIHLAYSRWHAAGKTSTGLQDDQRQLHNLGTGATGVFRITALAQQVSPKSPTGGAGTAGAGGAETERPRVFPADPRF